MRHDRGGQPGGGGAGHRARGRTPPSGRCHYRGRPEQRLPRPLAGTRSARPPAPHPRSGAGARGGARRSRRDGRLVPAPTAAAPEDPRWRLCRASARPGYPLIRCVHGTTGVSTAGVISVRACPSGSATGEPPGNVLSRRAGGRPRTAPATRGEDDRRARTPARPARASPPIDGRAARARSPRQQQYGGEEWEPYTCMSS